MRYKRKVYDKPVVEQVDIFLRTDNGDYWCPLSFCLRQFRTGQDLLKHMNALKCELEGGTYNWKAFYSSQLTFLPCGIFVYEKKTMKMLQTNILDLEKK